MKTAGIFSTPQGASREHVLTYEHSLISWKPIFAGLFVALVIHATLMALGVAIGGATVSDIVQNGGDVSGLALGSAIWIGVSALLSLAAGSYFAARTSAFITGRIGAAQGLTIAALFFTLMFVGAGQLVGAAGQGLGRAAGAVGMGATNLLSNTTVQNTVEDSLSGTTLRSPPDVVVRGLITRLLQGNPGAAKAYFAAQTGLSQGDLDARYATLETNFRNTVQNVSATIASATAKSALSVFFILVVGIVLAVLGGAAGAWANFKKPLADEVIPSQQFVPHPV
jgi:hypothetical protein